MKPVPKDVKKLSGVVNKEVVKKDVYDELVNKVNVIDTIRFVKKQIIMPRSVILKVKYLVLLT